MTKHLAGVSLCAVGLALAMGHVGAQQSQTAEALATGKTTMHLLPTGREADGIPGDFVLRNNRVHALVSGSQPMRRTVTATGVSPLAQGVLYDFDIRGEENDQLERFQPGGLSGEISYVRVVEGLPRGTAAIEVVRYAAIGDGIYTRHEYRLQEGWQHLLVTSTYRNESTQAKSIAPAPVWSRFPLELNAGGVRLGDSINPFDKRGYAYGPVSGGELPKEAELRPGEERTYAVAVTVADSPLAAYGVLASLRGEVGQVSGSVLDPSGKPAIHGRLMVQIAGQSVPQYPDRQGRFAFALPSGSYEAVFEDNGRDVVKQTLTARAGQTTRADVKVSTASVVEIDIRDEQGRPSPAKVQFIGLAGTPAPNFGPDIRARGSRNQYSTHNGVVSQQTPPGRYTLRITRGPEFDMVERTIDVGKGQTVSLKEVMRRTVDTRGWIATDFHAHTTLSGGGDVVAIDDRLIDFAAENLEFVPTTEHARLYDWTPDIARLGLSSYMKTTPGIELTVNSADLTAFPLTPDPTVQDAGAPPLNYDPRVNAMLLRDWSTPTLHKGGSFFDTSENWRNRVPYFGGGPDRWVHLNHPVVGNLFFDRDGDQVPDGGFVGLEDLIDGAEFFSTEILNAHPIYQGKNFDASERFKTWQNRTFAWLQLLNQGRRVWALAVSDPHRIYGNGSGSWRTYIPASTENIAELTVGEIVRNAKAGRMVTTNGPFLTVTTDDGQPIGSTVMREGEIGLHIKVQTANWMEIDRVQILVNGRQPAELNFTKGKNPDAFKAGPVAFERMVRVPLQGDAHLIVVAIGENSTLEKGWGLTTAGQNYGAMPPVAYTNPIFVDVDRNGFKANGDTLGHPLPVTPPEHTTRGGTAH